MSLLLPASLPAIDILASEGIHLSVSQPSERPLRVALLNLMPTKVATETDFARVLSETPLPVEIVLMRLRSHTPRHVSPEHMDSFYRFFDELRHEYFDGLIVTGAPLEQIDFSQVTYWNELREVFDWARATMRSTLYICWAAQAGLFHHFGIPKYLLPKKMFGIFPQQIMSPDEPLFIGFDHSFLMPHSRHAEVHRADILADRRLLLLADGAESGVSVIMARGGREVFFTGHSEYNALTLDSEFRRDLSRNLPIEPPRHYYPADDSSQPPLTEWIAHSRRLFNNWLAYYVNSPLLSPLRS